MKHAYHHPSDTTGRQRQGYRDDARSEGSGACTRGMMTDEQRMALEALLERRRIRRGAINGKLLPPIDRNRGSITAPPQPKEDGYDG